MPLKYSLDNLIQWKILHPNKFKEYGITQLLYVTGNGIEEITIAPEPGKTLRIIGGGIECSEDVLILQKHAKSFYVCGGDVSLSGAFLFNHLPVYIPASNIKYGMMLQWKSQVSKQQKWPLLERFLQLLIDLYNHEMAVYKKNTSRKPHAKISRRRA